MPSRHRPSSSFYGPRPVSRDGGSSTGSFESNDDIYEFITHSGQRVHITRPRKDSTASSLGSASSTSSDDSQRPECDSTSHSNSHHERRQSVRPLPNLPPSPQSSASFNIPPNTAQDSRRKSRWLPVIPLSKTSFPEIAPTECSTPSMMLPPTLVERPGYEEDDTIDWDLIDEIMATHH